MDSRTDAVHFETAVVIALVVITRKAGEGTIVRVLTHGARECNVGLPILLIR